MRYLDWRDWLPSLVRLWRSSLQLRTVVTTVILSALTVGIIGGYMALSVGNNLFESRRQSVLDSSARATLAAQGRFDAVEDASAVDLDSVAALALAAANQAASTPASISILRTPGQLGPNTPVDRTSGPYANLVSRELREQVASAEERRNFSQSVLIEREEGASTPGIVVGSQLTVPGGVQYELYLVYDLRNTAENLSFIQQTLLLGGLSLIVLIGAVTYVVVRLVVGPVRMAAETSQKLAAGDLEVRIPVKGDDVIATLARSFNGMAESMQQQITRLAALSQVQQRFVSDVSHELRTPLTTIRLAGDVLYDQRESFAPATERTAELLHTQVERFEALLADLLEMSRYDAGAVEMELEPTSIVRLVEDAIEGVRPLSESKGSDLRLVAPGGYFEAEIDARRIRRIVQNLLGNAIDHGEGKPIVVYVDSDADAVAVAVRDYGVGMTPESVGRVFDRFWRADPSRQRTTGGTGLGLAISLEDAALHGGWLEVWSEPGNGSCFRLTLPRRRGDTLSSSPLELPPPDQLEVP
jgi:two-component system sensor histidine kinase MtrB